MNNIKISIIVPVYNVEHYIKECFDSIAAQTYKGEIECIFVDDCGQDNSVAVLVKLIAEYNGPIQFSIVHHEHNKGLSGARNTGIRNAQGDYLYFIDSDDSITSDCIEKLVALAEKYPGVEMVQGSTKSHRSWLSLQDKQLPCYSSDRHWIMQAMLARYIIPLTSWNKMIIKPLVINENLFFEEGLVHEDEMWNFILAKHIRTIAFCFEDTYIYRENPNGIMHGVNSLQYHLNYKDLVERISRNISRPYSAMQIECLDSILQEHIGYLNEDDYLKSIPINLYIVKGFLAARRKATHFSCKSLMGLFSRILYRLLYFLIDNNRILNKI